MDEGKGGSLLHDSRDVLTGGFHPLLLWRDRQRILAQPEVAAQPRPPLANAPLRFTLALSLTPLLVVAWLTSMVVGLLPERTDRVGIQYRSATVIEALAPQLPDVDRTQVDALARSVKRSAMVPAAKLLDQEAMPLAFFQATMPSAERRTALQAWAARLRASDVPRAQQDALLAKLLKGAYAMERGDRVMGEIQRNVSEGGPLFQVLTALSMIFSAWLFGQMLRGDARFGHAPRGDSFYLYYTTSRVFWFLPAQTLAYGVVSFGSASGNVALMQTGQVLLFVIAAASLLYLLAGAGAMARALGAGDAPPRGGAWAIGWRMLVAMGVATLVMMLVFALLGVVVAVGSAMLG